MSDGNDFSVNDEELGYRVLRTQPSSSSDVSFTPFFHRDQVLADEALQLCWNLHTPEGGVLSSDMDMDERLLSERQSSYGIQMAPVFAWTGRVFSSKEHVPKYLEYLPWIRYMVGIDNAAQELLALTTSQTRRTTINSKKAQNPRLINLNATVLEALGNTTLVLCDSES